MLYTKLLPSLVLDFQKNVSEHRYFDWRQEASGGL